VVEDPGELVYENWAEHVAGWEVLLCYAGGWYLNYGY
jgi:hypothetical protein